MKPDASEPVTMAISEARKTLGTSDSADQRSLEKEAKQLPRDVRRSVNEMIAVERAAKYQPYLLESQRKTVERAKKKIAGFSNKEESKEERASARKQWFAGLALNYLIFLVLLAGFWYLGTAD